MENVIAVLQTFSKFSPEQQQQILALIRQIAACSPQAAALQYGLQGTTVPQSYAQVAVQPVNSAAVDDDYLEILGGGIAGLGAVGGVIGVLAGLFPPAGGALLLLAGCLGGSLFFDSTTSVSYGDLSFQRSR